MCTLAHISVHFSHIFQSDSPFHPMFMGPKTIMILALIL